ncbi:uncharacterized protein LOC128739460 [Sabethes cyaneus]|uniref:uncharacterized protein LOC128739460 n=1 Tax=Sabethes cyaneus TaxID=53552 RepID=UPI00237D776E|nr:uncharacterized protein LOC128739460 [Sabethes cyaneus]
MQLKTWFVRKNRNLFVTCSVTGIILLTLVNISTTEEVPADDKSKLKITEKIYSNIFIRKREDQKMAVKHLLSTEKYSKKFDLLKLSLKEILRIIEQDGAVLREHKLIAGSKFPTDTKLIEPLTRFLENTCFVAELILHLPDMSYRILKNIDGWRDKMIEAQTYTRSFVTVLDQKCTHQQPAAYQSITCFQQIKLIFYYEMLHKVRRIIIVLNVLNKPVELISRNFAYLKMQLKTWFVRKNRNLFVTCSVTGIILLTLVNISTTEEVPADDKSKLKITEKIYSNIFIRKREDQKMAVKHLLSTEKYSKKFDLLKLSLKEILRIIEQDGAVLREHKLIAGSKFPTDTKLIEPLTRFLENTCFVAELILHLPDMSYRILKNIDGWRDKMIEAQTYTRSFVTVLDQKSLELLGLFEQEINERKRSYSYVNPYKENSQPTPKKEKATNKKKLKKGPQLSEVTHKTEL